MYSQQASRALAFAQQQWNGFALRQPSEPLEENELEKCFKSHQILLVDEEILVTNVGFVVMAVHTDRVRYYREASIFPGVDSRGVVGSLVIIPGEVPFHSYSSEQQNAYSEAKDAIGRARSLQQAFGGKQLMREQVKACSWSQFSHYDDLALTGLCDWGVDAFLSKYRLHRVARRFGLPRFALRLAGSYGDQVTAATLIRLRERSSHRRTLAA